MTVKTAYNRLIYLLAFITLASTLTGCIQADAKIVLNNDGSGKVIITELITKEGINRINTLSNNGSIPRIDITGYFKDASKSDTSAELQRISSGISCDSVNTFIPQAGGLGRKSVFSFKDINKVRLFSGNNTGSSYLKADFTGAEINISANINPAERDKILKILRTINALPNTIRAAFTGMKVKIDLSLPREIQKTTASFVHADNKGITFLDIDIGKLIATPGAIDKLKQFGNNASNGNAYDIPNSLSLKLEPKTEIYIKLQD